MATYDLKYPGAAIDAILDTAYDLQNAGYIFRGLASEYSNTPTERSWVLAGEGETGHGFTSAIPKGYIGVCVFNGTSWTGKLLKCVSIDSTPTNGSANALSSGGAYASISQLADTVNEALDNLTFTDTTPSAFLGQYITEKVSTTNGGLERILTYFTILAATTSKAGLLSAADKAKLDAILGNLRSLEIDDTTAYADLGDKIVESIKATIGGTEETISTFQLLAATASKAGLLSAADKAKLDALWSSGYQFAGIATPSTTPVSTTSKIFYIATEAGTYFNAITVTQGINILSWDGSAWSAVQVIGIDSEPTAGSTKLVESGGVIAHEARMLSSLFTKPTVNDSSYINIENGQYQQPSGLHTKATRSYTPIPDGCDVMALGYTGQYQTALALYSDEGSEYLVHLEEQSSYAYYTASELEEMGAKYCRMTITDEQAENGEWFLVVANLQEYFNSRINSSIKVVYAPDLKASANSVTIDTLYLLDRGGTRTVLYADGDSTSHTPVTFTFRNQAYVLVADKDGVIKTRINTTRVEADDVLLLVFSTNGKMLGGTLYPQWINALNGFVESNDILDSDLIPGGGIKKSNGERNANASYLRTDYIKIEQGMNVSVLGAETSVITPLALYSAPSPKAFVYAEQENATVSMSFDEMDALGAKYFRCSFSTSQISSGNWYLKFLNNRIVNTKIDNIEGTSTVAGSIDVVVPRRVADSLGNELTPTSIPTDGNGWETPTKKEILYIQKKAQQMLDIVWTPKSDVPHGNNDSVFEGGVPVTGLPYSSTKEIDKYIGFDVSIYTFMTAVNNPYSLLYTENIKASASKSSWGRTYHGVNNCAPYFGTVCSVLTGYATGQVIQWSSGEDKWCAEKNLNMIKVYKQDSQGLRIGDIYWKQGHNRLITGLKRDENGDVVIVHLVESYGAKVRETEKTASNFDATMLEENGIIYRNIELYKNSYTPSEFVAVDGETITPFAYNNDICTFAGDKASFREGELVVINYDLGDTPSHEWTGIEVYKDDVLVETYILSEIDQDEVPDGQKNHALIFEEGFEYGMYKARLTDGSNYSDYTYWEVIETNVSYESSGEIQKMEYSSSNGTPLSFTVCDEGGTIYAHNELSIENVEDGYVQIDLMKLFKSQYPSRTFSPDTYLKIHFEGKYGRVTNEPLSIDVI